MKRSRVYRVLAVLAVTAVVAAACSSSKKSSGATSPTSAAATPTSAGTATTAAPQTNLTALGLWNDAACSPAQPKVGLSLIVPIQAPGVSLGDYADASQAAVAAFNKRGGVQGRCLDLKVCDSKGDGPTELACARNEVGDSGVVAGITSTFTSVEADAYQLFESARLAQVGAQPTLPSAWNSPVCYEYSMGGSGTLLADIPALKNVGVTKFVVFVPQSGQSAALKAFAAPLINALGMQLLEVIEIPPTAVDFTQFVERAQNEGAQGAVLGLPGNVGSQIIDAMDSLKSTLKLAGSWGTFSRSGVEQIPSDIAKNTAYSDAVPPVGTDISRWPVYNVMLDDFKAANKSNLTRDNVTVESIESWLSVYAFVKVMRDSGATDITRATVKQAFDQAKDVPMFGLIPAWTPSKQSTNAIFKGISNSSYWTGHWDPDQKQFVVDSKQVDILALLG